MPLVETYKVKLRKKDGTLRQDIIGVVIGDDWDVTQRPPQKVFYVNWFKVNPQTGEISDSSYPSPSAHDPKSLQADSEGFDFDEDYDDDESDDSLQNSGTSESVSDAPREINA